MKRPSRLQIVYQRNYLLAMLIVGVCFSLTGWGISFLNDPGDGSTGKGLSTRILVPEIESDKLSSKRPVSFYQPYADAGFLGFIRLDRHLTDKPGMTRTVNDQTLLLSHQPVPSLNVEDISISVSEDDDTAVFLPDNFNLVEFAFEDSLPITVQRDVHVLSRGKPEYPAVARMDDITGVAEIVIRVDETGHLAPFSFNIVTVGSNRYSIEVYVSGGPSDSLYQLISREEPRGWFFGKKLSEFIFDSCTFIPAIDNNKPVSQFVLVEVNFCLGSGCMLLEYRSAGLTAKL
ncbi:MAG: hypothetical protein PHU88_12050 [candidate division Zixibacteria bacterium]|nr:hypothetical protein [candidate division Zixibacteria bacterium]MDD5425515.1 hypothetical protein [candidate division Zixibacteria bacterium]